MNPYGAANYQLRQLIIIHLCFLRESSVSLCLNHLSNLLLQCFQELIRFVDAEGQRG